MLFKIQRYAMQVPDVSFLSLKENGDCYKDSQSGVVMQPIRYRLEKDDHRKAWEADIVIPLSVFRKTDNFITNGAFEQSDVDIINNFFISIDCPEIQVLLDQA